MHIDIGEKSNKVKDCMDALIELEDGTYTKNINNDLYKIIVKEDEDYYRTYVSVLKNNVEYYKYQFDYCNLGKKDYNCVCEVKFVKENYSILIHKTFQKLKTYNLLINYDNNIYRLEQGTLVDETNHKIYSINDGGISTSIDSRSELEYDFLDKSIYMYYKKYDRKEDYFDKDNSIKFPVTEELAKEVDNYNNSLENALKTVSLNSKKCQFRELLASLKIPALNTSFYGEVNNLKNIINIYKKYQPLVKKYENEIFNEIYDFVMDLYYNPENAKINNFKNLVIEGDYSNPDTLKEIKKEVKLLQKDKIIKKIFRRSAHK